MVRFCLVIVDGRSRFLHFADAIQTALHLVALALLFDFARISAETIESKVDISCLR
jgi:hypothetical protein